LTETILEVNDLSFRYRENAEWALKDVSFSVKQGEWFAIVGHNGSGKSTMAKILNGLLIPQNGTVTVGSVALSEETIWDVRKEIGMVFQNPDNQFVGATVKDDVAFGLENNGISTDEMLVRVEEAMKLVNMSAYENQEPHHLSGGQKQRVAIAGIIAVRPSIIVLDEATSMLDPIGRKEVLETVRQLKEQQNLTIISITHDLEEVAAADRGIVMNKGRLFAEGTPNEIFALGDKLTTIGLDLPFAAKLSQSLKQGGFPISNIHITDEDLVKDLWTLYSKM
jgi:energy-coupling factor transport system ATP-binding protein